MAPVRDTSTDGGPAAAPWARSPAEIDETYALLAVQMQQIAARPVRTVEQLNPGEHYALGVRAAARWTMDAVATAPLTDEELPPDVDSAATVLALAEYLMASEGTPDQVYALAGGVKAWLVWLVGAEDRMVFRSLD